MNDSDYVGMHIDLRQRQIDYLNEMAESHGLPDASKVLRCLIDFAMTQPDQEQAIFAEIRCMDC